MPLGRAKGCKVALAGREAAPLLEAAVARVQHPIGGIFCALPWAPVPFPDPKGTDLEAVAVPPKPSDPALFPRPQKRAPRGRFALK